MPEDDIEVYIQKSREQAERLNSGVKDFTVFDLNHIPDKPLIREEVKKIVDVFVRYHQTGIPRNLLIAGARGSGKTLTLKYLAKTFSGKLGLPFHAVNCRVHNTSFKALAHMLKVRPRGYSYSELCTRFEEQIPDKAVIVLDEVDMLSEKDFRKDILYFLSRSVRRFNVVLLSNNPKFVNTLDESTRSSLQPDLLVFRNYSAVEIHEILQERARVGLHSSDDAILAEISALVARNTNSDIRVAIRTLLYVVTHEASSVAECFDQARHDIMGDMLQNLNDKALLVLRSAVDDPTGFVKQVYTRYCQLSRTMGEDPYSYYYFYSNLAFLQSVGLLMLVSAKVDRAYTNRIHPLVSKEQIDAVMTARFRPE
ncbi:MAG: orc1/cdc6 family replication initiation protein [Kiritimatiellae bacterium]|nr:orc1/cdc6 family replication initiation protein [Kiritimatiellia bacterium]MDD5519564.1 orc1/cdc6 family replication initiation protein [Kiritimatiellia bacterium]